MNYLLFFYNVQKTPGVLLPRFSDSKMDKSLYLITVPSYHPLFLPFLCSDLTSLSLTLYAGVNLGGLISFLFI